jgi:hypothetical protein
VTGRNSSQYSLLSGPFDFSSFLLPPDPGIENEWFSDDFYSAMRETGNVWGALGELLDPNFLCPGQEEGTTPLTGVDLGNKANLTPDEAHDEDSERSNVDRPGRISRISSPPNEASEEDKWPFQWNPKS